MVSSDQRLAEPGGFGEGKRSFLNQQVGIAPNG